MRNSLRVATILYLSSLCCAETAAAQLTSTFVSATKLECLAWNPFGQQTQSVPSNYDLSNGLSLVATPPFFRETATLDVRHSSAATGLKIQIQEAMIGTPATAILRVGRHATLWTVMSVLPIDAICRVRMASSGSTPTLLNSVSWSASVRVGSTAAITAVYKQSVSREFRVRLDPRGLAIRVDSGGWANTGGFKGSAAKALGSVVVEVLPIGRAITFGKLCNAQAPLLSGEATFAGPGKSGLRLSLIAATPHTTGGRLVGSRALSVMIPGTGCWLNTDYVIVLPFTTDARGRHETTWPIPIGAKFNLQDALLRASGTGVSIKTSNGLRVEY